MSRKPSECRSCAQTRFLRRGAEGGAARVAADVAGQKRESQAAARRRKAANANQIARKASGRRSRASQASEISQHHNYKSDNQIDELHAPAAGLWEEVSCLLTTSDA